MKCYKKDDVGCYIDGALGSTHRRQCLQVMLTDCFGACEHTPTRKEISAVIDALGEKASDDLEEETEATELLQAHTADGLIWLWEAGDLVLTTEGDSDE